MCVYVYVCVERVRVDVCPLCCGGEPVRFLPSPGAFMHVIICVHNVRLLTMRASRRRRGTVVVKASEVEGSVKMMFDMRKEARSRGTCSLQQQVA